MKRVLGYCVPWSVSAGDKLEVKVSALANPNYRAEVVRVVCSCALPGGPPQDLRLMPAPINGPHIGKPQLNAIGSAILVDLEALSGPVPVGGVRLSVWPTLIGQSEQTLIAFAGFSLSLQADRRVLVRVGAASLVSHFKLTTRTWYDIDLRFGRDEAVLTIQQLARRGAPTKSPAIIAAPLPEVWLAPTAALALAALPSGAGLTQHFNGKLSTPVLLDAAGAVIASWDFARDPGNDHIHDTGPHALHGRTVNLPSRAVTGPTWTGDVHDWRFAPDQYAAIHFHEDDLYDAGWETSHTLTIPQDWPSGYYAVRLTCDGDESWCPFFVTPRPGKPTARLAVIASTATSIAYANQSFHMRVEEEEPFLGRMPVLSAEDVFLRQTPWLGLSHYDTHADGSGVRYSSRLRPVINMGPFSDAWNLNADTLLYAWLAQLGQPFDLLTDEDIHRHGLALLEGYTAVIAGSHPEYHSTAMLDALEAYLGQGGRLMYLGGNGFYWRVAFSDVFPGALELRRAESGARYWAETPGEAHMAFTGELGGLWRRCGRPPQALVGVGMRAIGFDGIGHFDMQLGARDPRAAFLLGGIEHVTRFGEAGLLGSAAGEELDATDEALGTPRYALTIASSGGHTAWMQMVPEDMLMPHLGLSGAYNPNVRADVVFFETPSGGAVFSTGSMTWTASLHSDQVVARMTQNALERFLDPTRFSIPEDQTK